MPFKPPWVWIREDWEAKQRRFQQPREPRGRAMTWLMRLVYVVVGIIVAPFVIVALLLSLAIGEFLFFNPPVQTPMTIDVSDSTVMLERRSIHLILAEFERELVVLRNGLEVGRAPIALDSGGGGRMNVYQIDDDTLVMVDRFGARALHLTDVRVSSARELPRELVPGTFLGAFDRIRDGNRQIYRFIPAGERLEQPIEWPIPGNEWPPRPQSGKANTINASPTVVSNRA